MRPLSDFVGKHVASDNNLSFTAESIKDTPTNKTPPSKTSTKTVVAQDGEIQSVTEAPIGNVEKLKHDMLALAKSAMQSGKKDCVRDLLKKYKASSLGRLATDDYASFLKDLREVCNAE